MPRSSPMAYTVTMCGWATAAAAWASTVKRWRRARSAANERRLPGFIDDAHAAAADLADQFEFAEAVAANEAGFEPRPGAGAGKSLGAAVHEVDAVEVNGERRGQFRMPGKQ